VARRRKEGTQGRNQYVGSFNDEQDRRIRQLRAQTGESKYALARRAILELVDRELKEK
jgi:predicted transcriptional regulator